MAGVVGTVDCLAQGTQHHRLQQLRVGTLANGVEQAGVILGPGFVAATEREPGFAEEGAQPLELVVGRSLVHPEQGRLPALFEKIRRAGIGGQHALLDQTMGVIACDRHDPFDLALVVEDHLRLGALEIDRAALVPRLQQYPEDRVEALEFAKPRGEPFALGGILLVERGGHLIVGQARMRMHHRRIEAVLPDLTADRDRHVADHAQTIHLGIQRTQAVGQLFRQHRDHPTWEIHGVAAVEGITVECRARLDVVRHVGNRDDQSEAATLAFAIHRVVEIAGGLAVDRHQRQIADVLAPRQVLLAYCPRQPPRLGLDLRRELVRHVVLAQRDFDLHAGVGVVAEHLADPADRLGVLGRLLDQFDHDHLARSRLATAAPRCRRQQDVLSNTPVLGDDDGDAVLLDDASDDSSVGPFQNLHQLAFRTATPVGADDARDHPVAVEDLAHLLRPDEQIRAAIVADDEAEPVGMPLHPAADQVRLVGQQVGTAAVAHDLAVAHHRRQAAVEILALAGFDFERRRQRLEAERHAVLLEDLEDVLAARKGMRVAFAFAFEERIRRPDAGTATLLPRFAGLVVGH